MRGTERFCKIFKNAEQIGRLYILPHYHERGNTFRIYVLPDGEKVIENAGINPPLNKNAVEVYGIISGQPGWTEEYGWLHTGPWVKDFMDIVEKRERDAIEAKNKLRLALQKEKENEKKRIQNLLNSYI